VHWLLVTVLVVWVLAVVVWVHKYGGRSYLKLGAFLLLGALVAVVGFLILDLVWWAIGGFAAMLAGMGLVFGFVYWVDRRKIEATQAKL
jgi:hypothetical protein